MVGAAKLLGNLEKPIFLGEVAMDKNPVLSDRYNATEYPEYIVVYSFGRDPHKLKDIKSDM